MQVTQDRTTSLRVELLRCYLAVVNSLPFERYREVRVLSARHAYFESNGRNCDVVVMNRNEQCRRRAELSLSVRLQRAIKLVLRASMPPVMWFITPARDLLLQNLPLMELVTSSQSFDGPRNAVLLLGQKMCLEATDF